MIILEKSIHGESKNLQTFWILLLFKMDSLKQNVMLRWKISCWFNESTRFFSIES